MENIIKTYFEERYLTEELLRSNAPRPVITMSREFGCPSKIIAMTLVEALNKMTKEKSAVKWKFINKEIVEEAARELDMKTYDLTSLLGNEDKGIVKDLLTSFSPTYVNNFKIKKILEKVIRAMAQQGRIVMVGRGAAAILQGYPESLHIRLQAPVDWRIKEICHSRGISEDEALKILVETDKKRSALIELLLGNKPDSHLFDLIFNCSKLSKEEIVQSIVRVMEVRGMV